MHLKGREGPSPSDSEGGGKLIYRWHFLEERERVKVVSGTRKAGGQRAAACGRGLHWHVSYARCLTKHGTEYFLLPILRMRFPRTFFISKVRI